MCASATYCITTGVRARPAESRRSVGSDANTVDTPNRPDGLQSTRSPTSGSGGPTGRPGSAARRACARRSASPTGAAPMSDGTNFVPVRGIRAPPALGHVFGPRSCGPTDSVPGMRCPDTTERYAMGPQTISWTCMSMKGNSLCTEEFRAKALKVLAECDGTLGYTEYIGANGICRNIQKG